MLTLTLWHHGYVRNATTTASRPSTGPSSEVGAAGVGAFRPTTLIRLLPGRYLVAAIHDPKVSFPAAAPVLEKLRPIAAPITLIAGSTGKITVSVAELPR